jgi:hypothetical protein
LGEFVIEKEDPDDADLPDLFARLTELSAQDADEQLGLLQRNRPLLAARLSELIAADRHAQEFLDRPFTTPGMSGALEIGAVVDGFVIEGRLGSGSNGTVYRASQNQPRRAVALKVLHFALPSNEAIARFRREVRVLARLSHPGIVPLFAAGVLSPDPRALPWFAMELIEDAKDIRAWSRERSIAERIATLCEVCDAVHHAHLKQVIHRDLKPGNILVGRDGHPRVIDFGIATSHGSAASLATGLGSLTHEGAMVGTLAYMSPEQLERPSDVDARSDIYGLGVVLYELCTGRLPFELGTTPAQALRAVTVDAPIDPIRAAPNERSLRGDLSAIILKSIARDPERRYGSALELKADLDRWRNGETVAARRPGALERARRLARRRPVMATALVLGMAGAAGTIVASVTGASLAYSEAMRAQRYIQGLIQALDAPSVRMRGREARLADAADSLVEMAGSYSSDARESGDYCMIAGRVYESLGLCNEAIDAYSAATKYRTRQFDPDSPDVLEAAGAYARAFSYAERRDGRKDDPSPELAQILRDIHRRTAESLGWGDPRTIDAMSWIVRTCGVEDYRELVGKVRDASMSEDERGLAMIAILARSASRRALWAVTEEAWIEEACSGVERLASKGDFRCVWLGGGLAQWLGFRGDAASLHRIAAALGPMLASREIPASFAHDATFCGEACLLAGRGEDAAAILSQARERLQGDTADGAEIALRCRSGLAAALVELGRPRDAMDELSSADPLIERTTAGHFIVRGVAALALSTRAHARAACGADSDARADLERAQALAADPGIRMLVTFPRIERHIREAERLLAAQVPARP